MEVRQAVPESMEIKSTRQVAKAIPPVRPVEQAEPVEPLIVPSDAMSDMDEDESGARVEAGVQLNEVSVKDFMIRRSVPR